MCNGTIRACPNRTVTHFYPTGFTDDDQEEAIRERRRCE